MDISSPKSDFVNVNGIRLHYLDWGGKGPALLFLAGMGCSVHIFAGFAPRFTDTFHVLALDRRGHGDSDYPQTGYDADTLTEDLRLFLDAIEIDQVILAGHSMARIELCHFAALHPERVLKLIFLDAAYGLTPLSESQAIAEKDPLSKIIPAWPDDGIETIEAYVATLKWLYPPQAVIWGPVMDEQTRHTLKTTPDSTVIERKSEAITKALTDSLNSYVPEYSDILAPVLSFFAILDGRDYLSSDYMTGEQKGQVIDFFEAVIQPSQKHYIARFQSKVPHAQVVEIPGGHHYCFIKQEGIVFDEMRKFLLEA